MASITSTPQHDIALVVGRWHIVHKGHETLFRTALESAKKVVVVIGSAFHSRDPRNPFTWGERAKMIEASLAPADRERVTFLPIRDYHNNAKWNDAVRTGLSRHSEPQDRVILVGFQKDWTSEYLHHMGWQLKTVQMEHNVNATDLRNVYFEAEDVDAGLKVLEPYVSAGVLAYLQAWSRLNAYAERAAEHRAVKEYRKRWAGDAYLTADAVVRIGDHVLLIRRGGQMGHGLWALPGGFVEPNERFLTAAVRELKEETNFPFLEFSLLGALQGNALFDSPLRSPRGRLVTNAFYFRYGEMAHLPEVRGSDDAREAKWVPISELASMEEQFFEDHFLILDHFLGILQN